MIFLHCLTVILLLYIIYFIKYTYNKKIIDKETYLYDTFKICYIKSNNEKIVFCSGDIYTDKEEKGFLNKLKQLKSEDLFIYNNKKYKIFFFKEDNLNNYILIPYGNTFNEINVSSETAIALIFIDNFEDVMEILEEEKKPLIIAIIDSKLNNLAKQIDGVIKKFEKDRYIFIFNTEKLNYLKDFKFDILDQIRNINVGNKMPITLSMGIGVNGNTLSQNMEYARTAIDLALARGGDQVLIRNKDNYMFFGGKSKEIEVNARVRARVKAYALSELILQSNNVIIMGHKNPDLDSLGACIGVFKIVQSLNKKAQILINDIRSNSLLLYNDLIKLDSYKSNCFINSEQALNLVNKDTLVIVVDCHRPSLMECEELYNYTKNFVVFDHHRKGKEFLEELVLTYHEPYASSTCELITEMIQYVQHNIKLEPLEADALLAGITLDTKNFAIKTGARTFEAAAYLKRCGADTVHVKLYMQNDIEIYKACAIAINNAKIFKNNIAITCFSGNLEDPSITIAQIADELLNCKGIEASFVLYDDAKQKRILLSARSFLSINVQLITEKLGGGGHQNASGAQIYNYDLETTMEILKKSIEEYLEENKI